MPIIQYKPTTPGRRKSSVNRFRTIGNAKKIKKLVVALNKKAGRNSQGKITVRHRGGGSKKKYRIIDFRQDKFDIQGTVEAIMYDPNRSARIAQIVFTDGERRYILAPDGLDVGAHVLSSQSKVEPAVGNRMKLEDIPVGLKIHNIEMQPGAGGQLVRSAGLAAQLLAVEGRYAQVKLPSKEVRLVLRNCMATIGQVSNADHSLIRWGKAGRTRHRGIRPTVRGKAMNPVDHPHGGGEGGSPIGLLKGPKTPWGKKALGVKTRKKNHRTNKFIVTTRAKAKKKRK